MSDLAIYILVGVGCAFGALGGIYRVVDPDSWPWWLDGLASASWYVLAAIGGAVAALSLSRGGGGDAPEGIGHEDTAPEPTTAADEADQTTEQVQDDDESPSIDELADELDDLGDAP